MNCKPGDLAVTVGMREAANNGVIVEVDSLAFSHHHGVVWNIRHRMPMIVDCGRNAGRWVDHGQIHDSNLRPISGVPVHDEQLDEVPA
ncbi:hypothetical protein [Paraburkholderia tropica]|uniref:hypothetical protein n=1 Tax=Paraburkholderia tropica TaxID=92647 RepID=UPI002AB5F294|nr:hypothetical protein [Paraburkholderia tropica]